MSRYPKKSGGAGRIVWIAKYYRDRQGAQPVKEFIDMLPPAHQELIDRKIDRLNVFGPMIPAPHTKQIRGKLRRLKADFAGLRYRILYHEAESGFIVLLHVFVKKTPKISQSEIAVAESRWVDFERRMDEVERVPPRAFGGDAP